VNLQLDHFPMIKKQNKTQPVCAVVLALLLQHNKPQKPKLPLESLQKRVIALCLFEHGFHNVSRWMTWLPISLKNAAKCDKWYQLQNHSITESLNANGAREKPLTAIPVHAVSLSVEQKPNSTKEPWLVSISLLHTRVCLVCGAVKWLPRIRRQTVDSWVIQSYCFVVCVGKCVGNSILSSQMANQQVETLR
jgi:hypothetical protein